MAKKTIQVDRPCVKPGVTFEQRADGRFCLSCQELQHDLTDATQREALALIDAHGGRLCGTFRAGPDGTLRFKPEAPSRTGRTARSAALALALTGCGTAAEPSSSDPIVSSAPPPASAPPPETTTIPIDPETAPPESVAPTWTGVDETSRASEPSHATDASQRAEDHRGHWHTHAPVGIGGITGTERRISGGASAFEPSDPIEVPVHGRANLGHVAHTGAGEFDDAVMVRMLQTRRSAFQAAYERELRNNPAIAGDVVIALTLAESGAVSEVHATNNTTGDDALANAVGSIARGFRFNPGPEGGTVVFTIAFTFTHEP